MIKGIEKYFITILAGSFLTLLGFFSYEFYNESLLHQKRTHNVLLESNKQLNTMNSFLSEEKGNHKFFFQKKSLLLMFKKSVGRHYCRVGKKSHTLMKFSNTGIISVWDSPKKPFRIDSRKPPILVGYIFNYGSNLVIMSEDPNETSKDESFKVEGMVLDNSGALGALSINGEWFTSENCDKTVII